VTDRADRLRLIRDMPVIDVETGDRLRAGDLLE
jgi:hypothetical protein